MAVRQAMPPGIKTVLWLDPGVTTGWALYYLEQEKLVTEELDFGELVSRLEAWCSSTGESTIVGVERYTITPGHAGFSDAYAALYACGAAKSAAVRHGCRFVDGQTSSNGKALGSDMLLKECGWYSTTKGHANDAARHIGAYLSIFGLAPPAWDASLRRLLEPGSTEEEGNGHG